MISRRQRRRHSPEDAPACPVCGESFPSVRNFDPVDHERMIMRHITKCSAPEADNEDDAGTYGNSSAMSEATPMSLGSQPQQEVFSSSSSSVVVLGTLTPNKTGNNKSKRSMTAMMIEESPAAPGCEPPGRTVCADLSATTMNSLSHDIAPGDTVDLLEDSSDTESEVSSSASEVEPTRTTASVIEIDASASEAEVEEEGKEDFDQKPAAKTSPIVKAVVRGRSLPKAAALARDTETKPPDSVKSSRSARTQRGNTNVGDSTLSSNLIACPICQKTFPRMCYFAQDEHERQVLEHVVMCSSTDQEKQSLATGVTMMPASRKKKKASASTKRLRRAGGQQDTESSISSECSISGTTATTTTTTSKKSKAPAPPQQRSTYLPSGRKRPIDPGHFLNKMWWREKKTKRSFTGAKPFNLSQCVVAVEPVASVPNRTSSPETAPAGDGSSPSSAASDQNKMTRASGRLMSRYGPSAPEIKLCCPICGHEFTAGRMGAITEQAMSRHVTKCTQKMFDTGIDVVALSRRNQNVKGEKGGRRSLSEQEKKQREEANAKRARSMTTLLSSPSKEVFDEIFVKLTDAKY